MIEPAALRVLEEEAHAPLVRGPGVAMLPGPPGKLVASRLPIRVAHNATSAQRLRVQLLAEEVAQGHAFEKHELE